MVRLKAAIPSFPACDYGEIRIMMVYRNQALSLFQVTKRNKS
jgi:hypothetical protein